MKDRLSRYLGEMQEFDASMERLSELFIKAAELNSMPKGRVRDMQMLRLAAIAEFDAANLYEMMADLASIPKLRELLLEIANEEKVHIGEFEFALEHIDPEHEHFQEEGEDEAEELTDWDDEDDEKDVKESDLSEDVNTKSKMKDINQANKMRCQSILNAINQRREQIKALLLQGRQWGCGE
ncbi:MAG: ferritin family protein [Candidatus Heimdallarchaeaceae archaeon]